MTLTFDVTGLSPLQVQQVEQQIAALRESNSRNEAIRERTPEERAVRWMAFVAKHAVTGVVADDSREAIYGDNRR